MRRLLRAPNKCAAGEGGVKRTGLMSPSPGALKSREGIEEPRLSDGERVGPVPLA